MFVGKMQKKCKDFEIETVKKSIIEFGVQQVIVRLFTRLFALTKRHLCFWIVKQLYLSHIYYSIRQIWDLYFSHTNMHIWHIYPWTNWSTIGHFQYLISLAQVNENQIRNQMNCVRANLSLRMILISLFTLSWS